MNIAFSRSECVWGLKALTSPSLVHKRRVSWAEARTLTLAQRELIFRSCGIALDLFRSDGAAIKDGCTRTFLMDLTFSCALAESSLFIT